MNDLRISTVILQVNEIKQEIILSNALTVTVVIGTRYHWDPDNC